MERAREESEQDEGATPERPGRPGRPHQPGKRDDARPQDNVACEKEPIGRRNQGRVLLKCSKLLRKEEVKRDAKKNPDEEKEWAQDHRGPSHITPGKPELVALQPPSSSLGISWCMRV